MMQLSHPEAKGTEGRRSAGAPARGGYPVERRVFANALAKLGEPGREALRAVATTGEDVTERIAALEALAAIDALDPSLAPVLLGIATGDDERGWRDRALSLLAALDPWPEDGQVSALFGRLLEDPRTVGVGLQGLAARSDASQRRPLHAWAEATGAEARYQAGVALQQAGHDVDVALGWLLDLAAEDPGERGDRALIHVLGIRPPLATSRLTDVTLARVEARPGLLADPLVTMRLTASPETGPRVVPLLIDHLAQGRSMWSAARALTAYPDQAAQSVPAILDAYLSWGVRTRFQGNAPMPFRSALETLAPHWSGAREAFESRRRAAPPEAKDYWSALGERLFR